MVKTPCYDKNGLRKGSWTSEEDKKLVAYVTRYGCWNWSQLPKFAGLARCGKSCRLRWKNYLSPNIKRGNYTKEEEDTIIRLNESLGNKWSAIAAKLPGRTDNDIKNHWHAALKKRLTQKQNKEDQGKKKFRSKTNNIEEEANKSKNLQNPITPSIHESSASSVQPCSTDEQSSLISGNGIAADKDFDTILGEDNNALLGEHEALSAVVDNSYIANEYLAPMVNAAYVPNKGGEYKTLDGNFWTEPFLIDNSYIANECLAPMVNPGYVPNGEGEYETLNWDFWTEPFLGDNSYMANEYLAPILNPSC